VKRCYSVGRVFAIVIPNLQHKDKVVTLKSAIHSLYEERTKKHATKDKLKKDVRWVLT
jgi:hypothetical protein